MSSDLDHLFANTLSSLTNAKEASLNDVEKAKRTLDLTECLQTYDILGLWRDAEAVVRRELVHDFVKKVRITLLLYRIIMFLTSSSLSTSVL